jgi:hypothetical protein
MRAPDELPRRRRRRGWGGPGRGRVILVVALIALFILLTSLRGIAGFYTDYLWYDSLGLWSVQRGIIGAQLVLALIFITAFFLLAWTNLYVTEMVAPPFRPTGPEDELLERYHDLVAGRMSRVRIVVAGLLALIAGSGASAEWQSWILFTNGSNFGVKDPQFGRDVGFYVFRLPFISFVVDWLFASLLIVLIVSAVAHYLNGGIRVQPPAPRVTPQVKAHLSVLLAALALVKTGDYYLQRFELTSSTRGVVDGATYTDVHAQLPALNLLLLISVAAAALFVINIFRRGWALPAVAVVLWGFVAIVVGGIYPQLVQWRSVDPNVLDKESAYIERNITATRDAMGLGDVDVQPFTPKTEVDDVQLAGSASTIRNIRLWDPSARVSGEAFTQLQQIYDYYRIGDIDVDRYVLDGQPTQVNVATRNLEPGAGTSWEQSHLAYTHGYAGVVAPANATTDGEPDFALRDIPAKSDAETLDLSAKGSGIYIGEDLTGYSVVDTGRDEIDYQDQDATKTTTYKGKDGVKVNSLLRKAAFALRFGDINPLLSSYLDGDSKVIYIRDVVDRVNALAPFLHADADPYPVILDGKVTWVVDLYTTTDKYPYAQRAETDQLDPESDLNHRFNYVRNSVKATVDAYDGTVTFYVMDVEDPIIDAYRKAFPDLFTDDDMPAGLVSHLRYPEDLFRVQTTAWGRYHLDTPSEWYDSPNAWQVAADPGSQVVTVEAGSTTATTNSSGSTSSVENGRPIPPFYQLLQLPGDTDAEFVLMRPFVPKSKEAKRQQLTSFMVARMDPGHYGELVVYEMPSGQFPKGPSLVRGAMRADEEVSSEQTLLGTRTGGSQVIYGNLLMVPVDGGLLYVQPLYVESENAAGKIPRLVKVILMLDDDIVISDSLQEALVTMFDEDVTTQESGEPTEPGGGGTPEGPGGEAPSGTDAEQAAQLLSDASDLFTQANEALQKPEGPDWATFGKLQDEANAKLEEAEALLNKAPTTTTPETTEGAAARAPTPPTTAAARSA